MLFNPTEKAKGLLRDWHQICQDQESNAQPAWNKVRHILEQWVHDATPKPIPITPTSMQILCLGHGPLVTACIALIQPSIDPSWDQAEWH